MSDLELELWWEPRDPSQADDARRLSRFVNGLPDFDPIYRSWLEVAEDQEGDGSRPAQRGRGEAAPDRQCRPL